MAVDDDALRDGAAEQGYGRCEEEQGADDGHFFFESFCERWYICMDEVLDEYGVQYGVQCNVFFGGFLSLQD
jgi:hypothetical protein